MTTVAAWANSNGAGSTNPSVSGSPATGSGLVALFAVGNSQFLTGVTDNLGQTWTRCVPASDGNGVLQAWKKENTAAGVTIVTGTLASGAPVTPVLLSIDDMLTASAFDSAPGTRQQTGVTTYVSNTSAAAAQPREIAIAVSYTTNGTGRLTGGAAGYTLAAGTGLTGGVHADATAGTEALAQYKVLTAGGAEAAGGSCLIDADPFSAIFLFKLQAAGGGSSSSALLLLL